ncbi:MAG: Glyoxalase/bleomycin resistance protein/dioxygenase [Myxococcaceae bacterium]|nr:Glyoxalase/bleomycin resistance protein/dioxygenase [Myxococcaceae bacterium]
MAASFSSRRSERMSAEAAVSLLVNIDVDDLERATRFYTEALGLRVGRRFQARWVELLGAPVPIYLLEKQAGSAPSASGLGARTYGRHWTPVHLDIVVQSIERAVDAALQAGAVQESPIAHEPYGRIAMFADPFGHGFCLIEFRAPGYDAEGL